MVMDSFSSFMSSTSKLEKQSQDSDYRQKTRNRIIVISISVVLFVSLVVGLAVGVIAPGRGSFGSHGNSSSSAEESIKFTCSVTLYPDSCVSSITSKADSSNAMAHPSLEDVFMLSLQVSRDELANITPLPFRVVSSKNSYSVNFNSSDPFIVQALYDCGNLLDRAIAQVKDCISSTETDLGSGNSPDIDTIRTWLSTAITDQNMCLSGLMEARNGSELVDLMQMAMKNSMEFTSNSLAIASRVLPLLDNFKIPSGRKLLDAQEPDSSYQWIDRWFHKRLLLVENPNPDLIVAKDGTGNFSTITEALSLVPERSKARTVIYVKEGVYVENVTVSADLWNVMMYGDGMQKTIISGSKNYADGIPTYSSATFGADGRGFIAKDMGFRNTAGPKKQQAVALRASADQSVFYRCYFDAYQDTLFTLSGRQYYRDCLIIGTVDFIFGNSAAVFQNCSIQPREPMRGQFNAITAQGKSDPNQNTGISIQFSRITPFGNLSAQTYLGRPWENYSTTVFMQSNIGGFVNPMGWAQWKPGQEPPGTIFYAEYQNNGPGSDVDERAKWPGVRPNISGQQAAQFSVQSFIQGDKWLPKTIIQYDS